MDSPPLSTSANFIGVVTGGIAILGLAFYRAHLPKHRFRALEEVQKGTEDIWAAESPHFENQELRRRIEGRLTSYAFSLSFSIMINHSKH